MCRWLVAIEGRLIVLLSLVQSHYRDKFKQILKVNVSLITGKWFQITLWAHSLPFPAASISKGNKMTEELNAHSIQCYFTCFHCICIVVCKSIISVDFKLNVQGGVWWLQHEVSVKSVIVQVLSGNLQIDRCSQNTENISSHWLICSLIRKSKCIQSFQGTLSRVRN